MSTFPFWPGDLIFILSIRTKGLQKPEQTPFRKESSTAQYQLQKLHQLNKHAMFLNLFIDDGLDNQLVL